MQYGADSRTTLLLLLLLLLVVVVVVATIGSPEVHPKGLYSFVSA